MGALSKQPPAIVGPELQDAAIAALERRNTLRNATRRSHRFFVLRGLVYCMVPRPDHPELPCGRRMHSEAPPQHRLFHHCTHDYPGSAERAGGRYKTLVYAEALEDQVWAHIRHIIIHCDDLLRDMGLAQESDARAIAEAETAIAAAHRAVEGPWRRSTISSRATSGAS